MLKTSKRFRRSLAARVQWAATGFIIVLAIGLAAATALGSMGVVPVLQMPVQIGETVYSQAGIFVQVVITLLLLTMVACLPSGFRVLALERSHRDFTLSMSDVAEAYQVCHAADREGVFTMSEQFDAVKERIHFLTSHPDLGNLEPDVLESAAQMSFAARTLADTYSEKNVTRAREFLKQRQHEIVQFDVRLRKAKAVSDALRKQRDMILIEEKRMDDELEAFDAEYGELLAELGFTRTRHNIITMPANVQKGVAAE